MMKVEVFTQVDCSYCDMITSYLNEHNIPFEHKALTETKHKTRLLELKPDAKTVPQIFVNGVSVGGARESVDFFSKYMKEK